MALQTGAGLLIHRFNKGIIEVLLDDHHWHLYSKERLP